MVTNPEGSFRPYAPPANVIAVLRRLRRMDIPSQVGRAFLEATGVTEGVVPRVAAALRFLGLIDDSDKPTDSLRALATGTEQEYRQLLQQVIRTAYAEHFENVDPTADSQEHIVHAFHEYTPKSQHGRQVMLFLSLCREAGMEVPNCPRERSMRHAGYVPS